MNPTYEFLQVERNPTGETCTIALNNPAKGNALNLKMIGELHDALEKVRDDNKLKVVILTGAGKVFCTGGDITMFKDFDHAGVMNYMRQTGYNIQKLITDTEKVFIAKVNGYCLAGGLELVLCCDLIYANDKARFGLPEINLGILPGWGGTVRTPRSLPVHRAKEIIFTGRIDYTPEELFSMGLLTRVFNYKEFDAKVDEIAGTIASKSLPALRMAKNIMNNSLETTSIDAALAIERGSIIWLSQSDEARQLITDFIMSTQP
jgi:enoyl-CoA hydratase/carnithine racemase